MASWQENTIRLTNEVTESHKKGYQEAREKHETDLNSTPLKQITVLRVFSGNSAAACGAVSPAGNHQMHSKTNQENRIHAHHCVSCFSRIAQPGSRVPQDNAPRFLQRYVFFGIHIYSVIIIQIINFQWKCSRGKKLNSSIKGSKRKHV